VQKKRNLFTCAERTALMSTIKLIKIILFINLEEAKRRPEIP
jgi:hypothetical protein